MNRNPKQNRRPHALILGAVSQELAGLVPLVKDRRQTAVGRRRLISGRLAGTPVRLLITGPGIVNTVHAATAAVEDHPPALLIQTGCAGAFQESGLEIGDLAVAAEEIDVQLGIEPETADDPVLPLPFPLMRRGDVEIRHRYPLDGKWRRRALAVLEAGFAGICRVGDGPFATVSTITATDRRAEALYHRYRPCMEAMEGAGTAYLALHYDLPLVEIRCAGNRVGRRDRDAWNLDLAFQRSAEAVHHLLKDIAENGWEPSEEIRPKEIQKEEFENGWHAP